MTDVEGLVTKAVEAFSLTDFVEQTATVPTDTVTVYLDAETAYRIERLKEAHDEATRAQSDEPKGITDEDPADAIDEQLGALKAQIKESGLEFHLRSVGEVERDILRDRVVREFPVAKNASEDDKFLANQHREDAAMDAWIAASVVKIVRVRDGAEDKSKKSQEDIAKFRAALYSTEWDKLVALFSQLSFADALFERATDAGFPGGTVNET